MPDLAVVHLVREVNGLKPFERFMASYRRHDAGAAHELVLVFKGFERKGAAPAYEHVVRGLDYRRLFVSDRGFDIGAYFAAARSLTCKYLCFLNSFSEVLHCAWLRNLYQHIVEPRIGIVGATGTLESLYSSLLLTDRLNPPETLYGRMRSAVKRRAYRAVFPPFPNPHIRTNAFVIERELFLSVRTRFLTRKLDAARFESGRQGLTRRIIGCGLRPIVTGVDGVAYDIPQWRESGTYAEGNQENLLVADNRTRLYAGADKALRAAIAWKTWEQGLPFAASGW